jgi:DNA-binding NarL/FixJ family response regulator
MLVLEGLQMILEQEFEIAGIARDGYDLLKIAKETDPDVILIDISMPLMNGLQAARELRKIVPRAKLIFLTMHDDPDYVMEVFRLGASGYVLKQSAASELVSAIREVVQGHHFLTPLTERMLQALIASPSGPPKPSVHLTQRQVEVLQLCAEGRSAKEIAQFLRISPKTVEFHKFRLMRTLGVHTTAELTKYAIRHGIVTA